MTHSNDTRPIDRLLEVMAKLRDPDGGCPWDLEQTFETIAPYTIEEAYEVAEAIRSGDRTTLREELGDLLFQVVFYAQMSRDEGGYGFDDIAETEAEKMIRRHPHVFGDADIRDAADQTRNWEALKAAERAEKARPEQDGNGKIKGPDRSPGALDGIALALPALIRAEKLTKRAARVGFDWDRPDQVFGNIREELDELEAEVTSNGAPARLADELGDLLFAIANLARKLDIEPEGALRGTNDKFTRRFRHIEARLAESGKRPDDATLDEMDALWTEAKALEGPDGKPR